MFVLREGSGDVGTAFSKFGDAAKAGANFAYAEIVRANLHHLKGTALYCALFNRQLGDDARIVAVVRDGQVMILNHKPPVEEAFACPQGHVRGVVAPAGTKLRCGTCTEPLISG